MSSNQTLVVVALVLTIGVIIALLLIVKQRQVNEIIAINTTIEKISRLQLDQDIRKLTKMDLAGESLTTLTTWKESFQETADHKVPQAQQLLDEATELNHHFRLFKTRKELKEAQTIIKTSLVNAENAKAVFTELLESNRENKIQYDSLMQQYRQMRKSVLANSFDYGVALDKLEADFGGTEQKFTEVKNLSAKGDHVEAKQALAKIKQRLDSLQKKLPEVKKGQHDLEIVFQEQLSELVDAYKSMRKEGYYFGESDFLNKIKLIDQQIKTSRQFLSDLDVDEMAKINSKVKQQVASLYNKLTIEYKARPFIKENQDKLKSLFSQEQVKTENLIHKLQHIDESYELTHGELERSMGFLKEIKSMFRRYASDIQDIANGKGVFSEIKNSWLEMFKRIKVISTQQNKMAQDVDGLYESENIANVSIKRFEQEVSLVYRRLGRRNLPGTPNAFIQMYTLVVNEIGHLSQELNRVRINMEKVSDELIQISEDVERLKRDADNIINSANLVELTIQYSNKYLNNQAIKIAQEKSLQLYSQDYNYQDALDLIATAIEKVEPGSYQRLENLYYAKKAKVTDR